MKKHMIAEYFEMPALSAVYGDLRYVLFLTHPFDLPIRCVESGSSVLTEVISPIHRNPMNHHLHSPTHTLSFLLPSGLL